MPALDRAFPVRLAQCYPCLYEWRRHLVCARWSRRRAATGEGRVLANAGPLRRLSHCPGGGMEWRGAAAHRHHGAGRVLFAREDAAMSISQFVTSALVGTARQEQAELTTGAPVDSLMGELPAGEFE